MATAAEAFRRGCQLPCQVSGNGGIRRSDGRNYNPGAATLQGVCRPLAHPRANHHFATVKRGEDSRMVVRLALGGMVIARALGVRMLLAVGLERAAFDLPVLNLENQKTGAPAKVLRN